MHGQTTLQVTDVLDESGASIFMRFLRNHSEFLPDYTSSHARRLYRHNFGSDDLRLWKIKNTCAGRKENSVSNSLGF